MLTATGKAGRISAWEATKADGPFICPGCKWPAIHKSGYVKIAHFAHEPGADCPYASYHENESELHYGAKQKIYTALSTCEGVSDLKLERYLGPVRPDISFRLNGVPIAIEMQVSKIDLRTIERRTKEYTRRGIYLLWVHPFSEVAEKLQPNRFYDSHAWERYIHHNVCQGRFYYWVSGTTVRPVHFDDAQPGPLVDNTLPLQHTMMVARFEKEYSLTDLQPVSLSVKYAETEFIPREAKLLALPSIWILRDRAFVAIGEARKRYPNLFLDPAHLAIPSDVTPYIGDPFDEDTPVDPRDFLGIPPNVPEKCLEHQRLYRYSDRFGNFYCDHPVCWSRYRLFLLGAELTYPEVVAVVDPRDYLPDLTATPYYKPSPIPGACPLLIYPARPPVKQLLIASGETAWQTFSETESYGHIALALKTLEKEIRLK